jgi:membrane-associated protease RseP (regulator of RpoE activity)
MKLTFLWSTPALAAALWLGGSALSASAQSIDAAGEAAAGTATDAAAGSAADTGAAATTTDTTAGAAGAADASAPSTGAATAAADSSAATDASAGTDTVQSGAQSTISGDAATSADAQTATPPAPAQPGASAGISADAAAATSSSAGQPQTPGATSPDAAATAGTEIDASIQGDPNLRAGAQIDAQQRLNLQQGLQFGQATDRGLAINTIARDHFFFNSGLRPGDTLVSYAGRPIRSQADFNRWVVFQPGQRVPVVVLRNGRPQTIYVVYQQQQSLEHQAGYAPAGGAYLGVTFDAQNPQQAIVRTVNPGSPAERAGIRPGDVIFAVNGTQVGGSQDVIRIVSSMQPGEPVDVAISRQVVLGSRPGVTQAAAYSPDVRIQGSVAPQPTPAVPAVPAPAVVGDTTVDADADVVPGSGRFDNTPARAGDVDRDGRLLDADGRVGPVEGRAILPRRRN